MSATTGHASCRRLPRARVGGRPRSERGGSTGRFPTRVLTRLVPSCSEGDVREREAPSSARRRVSEARRSRFHRGRGPGTLESQSEIQSELNRFESAFDMFEREGETEQRWHVVSIAGAKREESYAKRLLEAFEKELKRSARLYTLPNGKVQTIECMTPVIRYQYRSAEKGTMLKRTVRWPASDVLWVSCVMTKRMRAFISRQTFVRNIFSSEIYVVLEDFAFQDQYDMAKEDEEGTLLAFTEMLKQARQVEYHDIEDPQDVGVDVHTQLTELFQDKYAALALAPEEGQDGAEDDGDDQGPSGL